MARNPRRTLGLATTVALALLGVVLLLDHLLGVAGVAYLPPMWMPYPEHGVRDLPYRPLVDEPVYVVFWAGAVGAAVTAAYGRLVAWPRWSGGQLLVMGVGAALGAGGAASFCYLLARIWGP